MNEIEFENLLRLVHQKLDSEKIEKWGRSVSLGDLVGDRWERAKKLGFGEGSSIYDNALVIGKIRVGEHTWVGPNAVLDGAGGALVIGDHCAISTGAQIYTHNAVKRCTTMGQHPIEYAPTTIGNGVFIGPNSIIAMGVSIGDYAVIGAMSFVNNDVPPGAKVWGTPARIQGYV